MTGHLLGAAGGVEAVILGVDAPERHHSADDQPGEPGSRMRSRLCPERAAQGGRAIALSNSFGFGGHNATIVMKKYEA